MEPDNNIQQVRMNLTPYVDVLRYLLNQQSTRKIALWMSINARRISPAVPRPQTKEKDLLPHQARIESMETALKKSIESIPALEEPRPVPKTIFSKLPDEVLRDVFSYCKPKTLAKMAMTCIDMYHSVIPFMYNKPELSSTSGLKALIATIRLDEILFPAKTYRTEETFGSYVKILSLESLGFKVTPGESGAIAEFLKENANLMPNIRKLHLPTVIALNAIQALRMIENWPDLVHFGAVLLSTSRELVDHKLFNSCLSRTLSLSEPTQRACFYLNGKLGNTQSLHLIQQPQQTERSINLNPDSVIRLIESSRKHLTSFSLSTVRDIDGRLSPSLLSALSIYVNDQLVKLVLTRPGATLDANSFANFSRACPNLTTLCIGGGPADLLSDEIIAGLAGLTHLKILYLRSTQLRKADSVTDLILTNRRTLRVVYVVGDSAFWDAHPAQVLSTAALPFPKLEILALCGMRRPQNAILFLEGGQEMPDYCFDMIGLCPKLYAIRLTPNPAGGAVAAVAAAQAAAIPEVNMDIAEDFAGDDDDDMIVAPGINVQGGPPVPAPAPNAPQPLGAALHQLEHAVDQAQNGNAAIQAQNAVFQALGVLGNINPNNPNPNPNNNNNPIPPGFPLFPNAAQIMANQPNLRLPRLPLKIGNAYACAPLFCTEVSRFDDPVVFTMYKRHIKHRNKTLKRGNTAGAIAGQATRPQPPVDNDGFPPLEDEDDEQLTLPPPLPPHANHHHHGPLGLQQLFGGGGPNFGNMPVMGGAQIFALGGPLGGQLDPLGNGAGGGIIGAAGGPGGNNNNNNNIPPGLGGLFGGILGQLGLPIGAGMPFQMPGGLPGAGGGAAAGPPPPAAGNNNNNNTNNNNINNQEGANQDGMGIDMVIDLVFAHHGDGDNENQM
ncbi:hypothetical protein SmJEL517_g01273 [Synchytrium microbalum]|uniref:F-box domain-containing protein n=1 Tax=Synchytrium microbalum TaxID=1806994 RepID=A0A507CB38_9FUNG|nr:uncharacterized protein SmJEL517_g01273 [Synchytrium microbalum]TPX36568.1 hypothetical protein SmJEL517_g01273 [Synchytrium microbalum]